MPRYVVSYIDWHSNNLTSEIVTANSWHDAVFKHSRVAKDLNSDWHSDLMKLDHEGVKQEFYNCDSMIEAIEID